MSTDSQAWTQDSLQHAPMAQSGKAASQDDRGQGWAQIYLKLSSGNAWVPGHELKVGFMGPWEALRLTSEAGQVAKAVC